jgi:integrase
MATLKPTQTCGGLPIATSSAPAIRKHTDEGISQIKAKANRYFGYFRAYYTAPDGSRVWSGRRYRDYDEAKAFTLQAKHEVKASAPASLTVGGYLQAWLDRQTTGSKRDGFRRRDASVAAYGRHLSRAAGIHSLPLTSLTQDHLESLYAQLADGTATDIDGNAIKGSAGQGIKAQYVRQIHKTLRTALDDAVERGLITRNPATSKNISLPGIEGDSEFEAHVITPTELELLYAAADSDSEGCLVSTILATGLRRSEACNLQWSAVDLASDDPKLYVAKTKDWSPKSKRSRRVVHISTATADRLRKWHKVHGESQFVFGHNGTALTAKQAETIWNRVRRNTAEPVSDDITPHSARHTIMSNNAAHHLLETAAYLGHSPQTALRHYYHPEEVRPAFLVW